MINFLCHGQKGTIGAFYEPEDAPYNSRGEYIDLIVNPQCIPSRMTIAQLEETILSSAGCYGNVSLCREAIPTDINDKQVTMENIAAIMKNVGLSPTGKEMFRCGKTGERIEGLIFVGQVYYNRLKHMVSLLI